MSTVAIRNNGLTNLHQAIAEVITETKGDIKPEFYERISDTNASIFADRGIPAYMPRNRVSRVITVNAKMKDGPERQAQSELLRSPEASVEAMKAELNVGEEFTVVPGSILGQLKTEYVQARLDAIEGDEEAFKKFAKMIHDTFLA